MTRNVVLALALVAFACKVEKTGQDTYKVVAPTPQAKAAAQKVKEQTETAAQKIGEELKKVGEKAKTEVHEEKTETTTTTTETQSKKTKHWERSKTMAVGRTSVSDRTQTLNVGDPAPDFELPGHRDKERFRLSDLRGKKNVVLAFYPLDWTSTWSAQMPGFEAEVADFERYDAQVVGISVDSIPSHLAFAKSLGGITKYPLLSDFHPKGEVSKRYGVWKEESGYCERAIIVIDKEGIVRYIDVHVTGEVPENAQILEVLRAL